MSMSEHEQRIEFQRQAMLDKVKKILENFSPIEQAADQIDAMFHKHVDILQWFEEYSKTVVHYHDTGEAYPADLDLRLYLNKLTARDGFTPLVTLEYVLANPAIQELMVKIEENEPGFLAHLVEVHRQLNQLLREVLPIVNKEVSKLSEELQRSLDYKKILSEISDHHQLLDFFSTIGTLSWGKGDVSEGEQPNLTIMYRLQNVAQYCTNVLTDYTKYIIDGSVEADTPNIDIAQAEEAFGAIEVVKDELGVSRGLYMTYKDWSLDGEDYPEDPTVFGLKSYVFDQDGIMHSVRDNPMLIRSLLELFQTEIHSLREKGHISGKKESPAEYVMYDVPPFDVTGLDEVPGEKLVVSKEVIHKLFLSKRDDDLFPGFFLEGLGEIRFANELSLEDFFGESAESMIEQYGVEDTATLLRMRVERTTVHEVFEHVVGKLSFDEMVRWEEALTQDEQSGHLKTVTAYARSYGASDNIWDQRLGKKEDFCDSGSFFVNDVYRLYKTAPARFEFMMWFFKKHLPPESRSWFDFQKRYELDWYLKKYEGEQSDSELGKRIVESAVQHEEGTNQEFHEKVKKAESEGRVNTLGEYRPKEIKKGKTIHIRIPIRIPLPEGE